MNDFCTLFDANYLPRGLVLYRTLFEHTRGDVRLRVLCMDRRTRDVLDRLALPGLETIGIDELERADAGLLSIKGERTPVEYCWTSTPALCLFALDREPALDAITYLDADLMFFHDPAEAFDEIGDASVAIVPHRYAPRWQRSEATYGIYNVEWVTFRNDDRGRRAVGWWRERCLEWCHRRVENGKFGDQKYLDDWPQRFESVHVVRHPGVGLAPWNVENHAIEEAAGTPMVDGRPLVFFHYHALRVYAASAPARRFATASGRYLPSRSPLVWRLHEYELPAEEARLLVRPYLDRLAEAVRDIRGVDPTFEAFTGLRADVGSWARTALTSSARAKVPTRFRRSSRSGAAPA